MPKFIKIKKYLINVDNIVLVSSDEVANDYNSSKYWLIRIKLNDGALIECARAETIEEIERLNFELYEEIKRLTA